VTVTCPAGHTSQATDYCDTCGIAIGDGAAAPAPVPPPLPDPDDAGTGVLPVTPPADGPGAGACPSCGTSNPANALFCENCGYDFTTGAMPRPAEPLAPPTVPAPAVPAPEAAAPASTAPPLADQWVAEVWIDPDWYADQRSTDPLPSPGLPLVVPLRTSSILIGRVSRSRNIHPDIDLSSDNGISRRHAQLTTDGTRWFVEDLGSSNGTYVGGSIGAMPTTPVAPGQRQEIAPDERIYLGAWTRLVIRKATPGEF
jgi:hypothetical protein